MRGEVEGQSGSRVIRALCGMTRGWMSRASQLHEVVWVIPKVIKNLVIVGGVIPGKGVSS